MKSDGFDTVDEYEEMKAARTTFITPDEEREFRRLIRRLYHLRDMLLKERDCDDVEVLAESLYGIAMLLEEQMDEFNYRMPNDEVTNEGGPKENEKD